MPRFNKRTRKKKNKRHAAADGLSYRSLKPEGQDTQPGATEEDMSYRSLTIATRADGTPETLDEKSRSVEVVGATENPVPVYDWKRGEIVPEILLVSGLQLPGSRQVVLLDTHSRWDTESIIGSYREMRIEGNELLGRAHFSEAAEAQGPWQKVREGHLTDFSAGYRVIESTYLAEGQKQMIDGREFEGPLKIATKWVIRELSACPIGADEMAKARAAAVPDNKERQTNNHKREVNEMDKKLREFLESRGLSQDATEEEAWRYLEKLDVREEAPSPAGEGGAGGDNSGVQKIDEEAIRASGARTEQARILEIRSMCDHVDHPELADGFIKENKTVDAARKEVFDKYISKKSGEERAGYAPPVELIKDERDKFRSAAEDSLLIRAGIDIEKPAVGARDLAGFSLRELARESLRKSNKPYNGNPMEMIGRALTTSDFPIILANVANKSLFEGYEASSETWPIWCAVGSVSDFKTHTSARASETDDLDEIREDGEYRYGSRDEAKEEYKIATYGKLFPISRQTIINDDLGALTDIPRNHGEAASRKVGDVVYAVVTANSAMGDGVALFHANHSNLGTAGALSEITIAELIKLMKLQKDLKGKRRLNIRPLFYLAPVALEGSAEVFFNSGNFAGDNKAATRTNPYAGSRFTRVYEPRLDDDSPTAWYLAGPKGKTVKVFFLGGNQSPYLETKQGWNVDGVEFKVRIDAGAKAMDWKALAKNAGA